MKIISTFLFLLFLQTMAISQSQFIATVNAKKIILGSTIEYSMIAKNVNSVKQFETPDFGGLSVISGPMRSSSTSIINGVVSKEESRVFSLIASKSGTFTIGKGSAIVNGKRVYTQNIKIEVVANKPNAINDTKAKELFVKLVPSDSTVYIGQQLSLTYILYTQVSVQAANILQESDYNGFYKEDNLRFSRSNSVEEVNGIQYHTSAIKQVSLFPQQTGTYDISAAIFKIGTVDPNKQNSRRSVFFRNNLAFQNVSTNALSIKVNEVPQPSPPDFVGGVGLYKINAQLDRNTVQNKKAFNINVVIEGDGDQKMFTPPNFDLGPGFEIYNPVLKNEQNREEAGRQVFTKQYQYTIVPQKEGKFNLKVYCSFFSSDSIDYLQVSKGPFRLEVTQGRTVEKIVDSHTKKELKPNWSISNHSPNNNKSGKTGMLVLLLGSLLGALGMVGYKQYQLQTADDRKEKNRQYVLNKKVLERLKKADHYKNQNNKRAFYDEIFKATQKYLSDKYGMESGNINDSKVTSVLGTHNIESSIVDQINIIINESQLALFGGMEKRTMQEMLDNLSTIIEHLEAKN